MEIKAKLIRIGNSLGIRIPSKMVNDLNKKQGDVITLTIECNYTKPIKPKNDPKKPSNVITPSSNVITKDASKPLNVITSKPATVQPIKSWKDYHMPVQTIAGKPQIQTNEFDEAELDFLNKYKASKPNIQALMKLNGSKEFGSEKLNLMLNSILPLNGLPRPSILAQIPPASLPAETPLIGNNTKEPLSEKAPIKLEPPPISLNHK